MRWSSSSTWFPANLVTFSDVTTQPGTTYYYVVTAVDSSANESSYSNEVQAVIP